MSKNRFDPILHHANTQQEDLAKRLSSTLQTLRDAEAQLQQLIQYREEYSTRQMADSAFSLPDLHNQQLFINQVNKAIEQQEKNIINVQRQAQKERMFWQQSKTRCDAIDEMIQKQARRQRKLDDYREQKENDEFNNRRPLQRPR